MCARRRTRAGVAQPGTRASAVYPGAGRRRASAVYPGAGRDLAAGRDTWCGAQPAAVSSSSSASPRVRLGSTRIPGLIVVVTVIFLRYLPLAAAGLSLMTSSIAAA